MATSITPVLRNVKVVFEPPVPARYTTWSLTSHKLSFPSFTLRPFLPLSLSLSLPSFPPSPRSCPSRQRGGPRSRSSKLFPFNLRRYRRKCAHFSHCTPPPLSPLSTAYHSFFFLSVALFVSLSLLLSLSLSSLFFFPFCGTLLPVLPFVNVKVRYVKFRKLFSKSSIKMCVPFRRSPAREPQGFSLFFSCYLLITESKFETLEISSRFLRFSPS